MSDPGKAVFLSYASQDAEAAKRIAEALRATGVEVWFDQSELRGGDAWDQSIRKQIKACALFVPVISANTQARSEGYFRLEWKLADDRTHLMAKGTRFILPVCVDDTKDWDAIVPDSFTTVQWTRLPIRQAQGPEPVVGLAGEGAAAFAERVRKLLSPEPGTEPVGRDRRIPPSTPDQREDRGGISDPALQKKRRLVWPWLVAAIVALPLLYLIFKPRRSPEEVAKMLNEAQTIMANTTKAIPAGSAEIARVRARLIPDRWQKGDFEAISPTLDRLIQANPEDSDAWALRSIINSMQVTRNIDSGTKPLEVSRAAADRALRLAPDSPLAELALGMHLNTMISRGGDPLTGQPHISRAVAALPRDALTRFAELICYWQGYNVEDTERVAQAWLAAEPNATYPAWILAQLAVALRRPHDAEKWAEAAAADRNITGTRAFYTIFESKYYLRADLAAAKEALARVPAEGRTVHRVIHARWLLAMAEQRWDEALQELARVSEPMLYDRTYHGPRALLAGLAHQRAGRPDAALAQFREAERLLRSELATDPDNEELHLVLAVTLACAGRAAEARSELALVEPLLRGRAPSIYWGASVVSIAQAYGTLGDFGSMAQWLRQLFIERNGFPFTPASLRLDPRFAGMLDAPEPRALLKDFAALDQPAASSSLSLSPSTLPVADSKSVAVLAFANLSDDKANEYFSDGISEELLNVLAKVPGLKVTARTSSFHFKGKDTPIPEIAKELGVAYVIEGSVRKSGDRVRITAQLIKAADGFHMWSDTFTRDLKDIFAVQDEIAGLIAKNLELKLGEGNRPARAVNPEAHQLYLQGKYFLNQYSLENARRAAGLLQRAVELDPDFALAWAALSRAGSVRGGYADSLQEVEAGFALARRAANQALALDPELAAAHLALAEVQVDHEYDWNGAAESLRRAQALAPTDVSVIEITTRLAYAVGSRERAVEQGGRAVALDPVNPASRISYGFALSCVRRFQEAEAQFRRVIELSPTAPWGHAGVSFTLVAQGRFDEAAAEAALEVNEWSRLTMLAIARWGQKKRAEADAALEQLIKSNAEVAAYQIAEVQAFRHDNDRAFEWLERAYRQRDAGLAWCKSDSSFESLHADPRWETFLRKLGLADDQLK